MIYFLIGFMTGVLFCTFVHFIADLLLLPFDLIAQIEKARKASS